MRKYTGKFSGHSTHDLHKLNEYLTRKGINNNSLTSKFIFICTGIGQLLALLNLTEISIWRFLILVPLTLSSIYLFYTGKKEPPTNSSKREREKEKISWYREKRTQFLHDPNYIFVYGNAVGIGILITLYPILGSGAGITGISLLMCVSQSSYISVKFLTLNSIIFSTFYLPLQIISIYFPTNSRTWVATITVMGVLAPALMGVIYFTSIKYKDEQRNFALGRKQSDNLVMRRIVDLAPDPLLIISLSKGILYKNRIADESVLDLSAEGVNDTLQNVQNDDRKPLTRFIQDIVIERKENKRRASVIQEHDLMYKYQDKNFDMKQRNLAIQLLATEFQDNKDAVIVSIKDITQQIQFEDLYNNNKSKGITLNCLTPDVLQPSKDLMLKMIELKSKLKTPQVKLVKQSLGINFFMLNRSADLVDYHHILTNKFTSEKRDFFLKEELRKIVKYGNYLAEAKNLKIYLQIEKNVPTMIVTDKERVTQILAHLIQNAIKFTEKGGMIQVRACCANSFGIVKFQIADTGPGMNEQQLQNLFKLKIQNYEGFKAKKQVQEEQVEGIGLYISSQIAHKLQSRIKVKSRLKEGTIFEFAMVFAGGGALQLTESDVEEEDFFIREPPRPGLPKPPKVQQGHIIFHPNRVPDTEGQCLKMDKLYPATARVGESSNLRGRDSLLITGLNLGNMGPELKLEQNSPPKSSAKGIIGFPGPGNYKLQGNLAADQSATFKKTYKPKRKSRAPPRASGPPRNAINPPVAGGMLFGLGLSNLESLPSKIGNYQPIALVVDDQELDRMAISGMINNLGTHEVCIATNGLEAVSVIKDKLEEGSKDISVFMDINMPICDGLEATDKIKRLCRTNFLDAVVKIVAVTGHKERTYRVKCRGAEMDGFYPKPISESTVREILTPKT